MKSYFLIVLALLTFSGVYAQDNNSNSEKDYKWQIRLRGLVIAPDESAEIGVIGGDAQISTAFVPELDFTYFFTKNFAAELILATAEHDVKTVASDISAIGGPTSTDIDLGSVWLLPPTLTAQYHLHVNDVFKPYIGAGINYTLFYSEDEGPVVKGIDYDSAVGFALQGGFDLMISERFFINIDYKKLFLNTDVTVDASNLADGLEIPADVDIDPDIFGFGVGMKF
ncbi:OmpW/AlkL family protein [Flavobacteriaceae bacterium 14752]|uniref:OmpW/AlkL family protein n=1 Tax=Mesohalobacter salilacus TaxID=2491711 RepID=UPI000F634014|nr:OmpW family protein [Flavobacteriaceae bacterium 14752]